MTIPAKAPVVSFKAVGNSISPILGIHQQCLSASSSVAYIVISPIWDSMCTNAIRESISASSTVRIKHQLNDTDATSRESKS